MATRYFFLTGTAKWAKLDKPDEKYGFYGLDLYLDDSGMAKFRESGLRLEIREDDDGEFIRLRRDPEKLLEDMEVKPKKLIYDDETKEYKPFDQLIGNGSFVNCKVQVYDSKKGPGHRLDAVAVEKLVPYGDQTQDDLPF